MENLDNWTATVRMMKGHYYEYDGDRHLVKNVLIINNSKKVDILTNCRRYVRYWNELPGFLPKWKPVAFDGVDAFDHIAYIKNFIALGEKGLGEKKIETLQTQFEELADQSMRTVENIQDVNMHLLGMIKEAADNLDFKNPKPAATSQAKTVASLTSQAAKLQANNIRALAAAQKIISPKGPVVKKAPKIDDPIDQDEHADSPVTNSEHQSTPNEHEEKQSSQEGEQENHEGS